MKKDIEESKTINFYKTKAIQKYLKEPPDEQVQYTGIPVNSRLLLCAGSGCGKTNCLMNYILQTSRPKDGTFHEIHVCYKVTEPLYELLQEKVPKDRLFLYKRLIDFPAVTTFEDKSEKRKLLIFDDCVADKAKNDVNKLELFFEFGRKKSLTMLFLTQSYFACPKFIRDQLNFCILLSIRSAKDLSRIMNEYIEGFGISREEFMEIFKYATTDDLEFLKIDLRGRCAADKRFSKGFLEYIEMS